jgi:TonB family protein
MTSRRKASPVWRFVVALLVASAVHTLAFWIVVLFGIFQMFEPKPPAPIQGSDPMVASKDGVDGDERPIEIQTLVDELQRPDAPTEAEKRAEEEKRKQEEDPNAEGQVVDIARPPIEERPDDKARFLAEYDSKVERETRGRAGRDRAGAPHEEGGEAQPREPSPPIPPGMPDARPGLPGPPAERARPDHRGGTMGQEGQAEEMTNDGESRRPGARGEPGRQAGPRLGEGGVPGSRGVPQPNLKPTPEMLTRAIGKGAGSPDYLRDIDDGESTALNAKKFKYASFFNRVKRAVAEEWHPDIVYLRHDPSGNVYGTKDRVTVLRVHLRPNGQLVNVTMLQASGVEFLDDEAIDAFRRAQPFVNPPQALIESDGLIHFNFGFIFELSGHTQFKVFRYQ